MLLLMQRSVVTSMVVPQRATIHLPQRAGGCSLGLLPSCIYFLCMKISIGFSGMNAQEGVPG